jgi:hypothetical protein
LDLNQRPSGYEPDELPDCSTPRYRIAPDWALIVCVGLQTEKGLTARPALFDVNGLFPATRRLQCLATTYSSNAWALVPSALSGFTAEFEMGSGGSQTLWSPSNEAGALRVLIDDV